MLTKISIENFKCFGERVEIPIKPITLLFGANSAGKSTVIQALLYAREVLERQNLDADKTISSGAFIDLGGFKNFVHEHDVTKTIALRFSVLIDKSQLPDYLSDSEEVGSFEIRGEEDSYRLGDIYYQFDSAKETWIEIQVVYNENAKTPYLSKLSTGIDGEPLATVEYQYGRKEAYIKDINARHHIFDLYADNDGKDPIGLNLAEAAFARCGENAPEDALEQTLIPFATHPTRGALPKLGQCLDLPTVLPNSDDLEVIPKGEKPDDSEYDDRRISGMVLSALMTQYIVAPVELLLSQLQQIRYIGPLREKPPRNYVPPRFPDASRWANGLAAWDTIYTADDAFIEQISKKLVHLGTGYTLKKKEYLLIPRNNFLLRLLTTNEAFDLEEDEIWHELDKFPSVDKFALTPVEGSLSSESLLPYQELPDFDLLPADVGEGISQVVPIVVACLDNIGGLACLEQAELHLHPRQQAELGDLFIEGMNESGEQTFLLETHSEHLILRVLRRIRETTKGAAPDNLRISPIDLSVVYVEQKGGKTRVIEIGVDDQGEFLSPWPDSFFEQDFLERFSQC